MGGTYSRAKPGLFLQAEGVLTISQSANFGLSYPLIRTRSENLLLRGEFNMRDDLTTSQGSQLFDDHTRVLSVGVTYDLADSFFGVNLVDFTAAQGLPILGATRSGSNFASHTGASGTFTKFDVTLSRLQQVIPEWNILAAVSGQYSIQRLLVEQQFGYGGEQFGRAYDPSEILGDDGIVGKVELQYTPAWGAGLFGLTDIIRGLQFYTFYDIGRVWNPHAGDTPQSASGASAGGGVRYTITDYISGYLEVAQPLTRPVQSQLLQNEDGKPTRVFFNVTARF